MSAKSITCTRCKGRKQLMGLGMMYVTCNICHGVGAINPLVDEAVIIGDKPVSLDTLTDVAPLKKKRGRPFAQTVAIDEQPFSVDNV